MQTFAVVAVRLIGLWIIAGATGSLAFLAMMIAERPTLPEMWGDTWLHQIAALLAPTITGVVLMAFSRPIARLISGKASAAPPDAPTVAEFTRIGVFLLGIFALLNGLPILIQSVFDNMEIGLNYWLTSGFGLLLVLLASPIGDLLQRLRGQR